MTEKRKREIQRGYVFRSLEDVPEDLRSRGPVFVSEPAAELRLDEGEDGVAKIRGHGAVFNVTADFGWRKERVRPGAFAKTIRDGDARGLFNHDPNWLLGRTRSGTMDLREDSAGLAYTIDPPKTDLIRDLVIEPLRRGDLSGSSFSFETLRDQETQEENEDKPTREIIEVRLFDVGPVTFPAYEATDADFRSWIGASESLDEIVIVRALRARDLTDAESHAMLDRAMGLLDSAPDQRSTRSIESKSLRLRASLAALEA